MSNQKVAIVTAASRGIGAAIARRLANDGFRTSIMSRSEEILELAEELGGMGLVGSVTDPADVERLVERTTEAYGRIDALVCNTGHPPKGDLLSLSDSSWHEGLDSEPSSNSTRTGTGIRESGSTTSSPVLSRRTR